MSRAFTVIVIAAGLIGCARPSGDTHAGVPTLHCPDDLDAWVGKTITLVGVQTRTKIPTVCGVDVDGAYELSDQRVEATGILVRWDVPPRAPGAPEVAWRGPGQFYGLKRTDGDGWAKTRPR